MAATASAADLASTAGFLSSLRGHADKPLVFEYGGRRVQPGYHVTEVVAASYRGLDCGTNPEAWTETVVQLWDVPGKAGELHMTAGKFLSIYDKVASRVGLEASASLVLECGDDVSPAVRYTAEGLDVEDGALVVRLEPRRASCKPRDRRYGSLGVTPSILASAEQGAGSVASSSCCGPTAEPIELEVVSSTRGSGSCCG